MDEFYKTSFARLGTLLKECEKLAKQVREIEEVLNAKEKIALSLRSYLRAELSLLNNAKTTAEFEKVLQQKEVLEQEKFEQSEQIEGSKEDFSLTPSNNKGKKFNKTHFVVKLIQNHNDTGLVPVRLFELTQNSDKKNEFKLVYIHNILGKLKTRRLVEKRGDNYFLTNEGVKFAEKISDYEGEE